MSVGLGLFSLVFLLAGPPGFVLLIRGLLTYRVGQTPYCAACDYNLTGRVSERCSECGAYLEEPGAIVHGELRRRPRLAVIGGLLLAFGMLSLLVPFLGVDWYRYKPTAWVISDLKSNNQTLANRAWTELQNRMVRKPLSERQQNRLISICLDTQAAGKQGGVSSNLIGYLGQSFLSNKLTDQQATLFLEQGLKLDLQVRPRVVLGDPFPCWLNFQLKWGIPMRMILTSEEFTVAGESWKSPFEIAHETASGTGGEGRGYTLQCPSPGRHRIFNRVRVRLFYYPCLPVQGNVSCGYGDISGRLKIWGNPIYDSTFDLEAFTEILPEEPPDYIKLVNDDSLAENFRAYVTLDEISFRRGKYRDRRTEEERMGWNYISYSERSRESPSPMPYSITADAYARVAGKEYRIGRAIRGKGHDSIHINIEGLDGEVEPFDAFDLVLRPNPRLARETLDIYEIYNGVIVKEGIKAEFKESERR